MSKAIDCQVKYGIITPVNIDNKRRMAMKWLGKDASTEFRPEQLAVDHVVDQSGMVDRVDKAVLMAEVEDIHREFSLLYEAFCSDPEAFPAAHPEIGLHDLRHFRELYAKGVPGGYIRRYGELRAEVEGEIYDFKYRCAGTTLDSLRKLKTTLTKLVETGVMAGFLPKYGRGEEYQNAPHSLNLWLRLAADVMKLEAVKAEMELRIPKQL